VSGYISKIKNEIKHFKAIEEVHELPESFHYVTNKYLKKVLSESLGISSFTEMIINYVNFVKKVKDEKEIEILSLGSGNCDFEIDFAYQNNLKSNITCLEINSYMLERGKLNAKKKGLINFKFIETDINAIKLDKNYDIIIANHSLHHFVELEHIFDEINNSMTTNSYFLINDMIGRNGHMFWDSTLNLCNRLWDMMPKEIKYNHLLKQYFPKRIQWDCSVEGFEGIRAQDILPLLDAKFKFKDFGTFFSLVNRFIDRDFGHNFNINNDMHKSILDMLWNYDDFCLVNKILKPTQMIAAIVKKEATLSKYSFTYFEKPQEVITLDESKLYRFFDCRENPKNLAIKSAKPATNEIVVDYTLDNVTYSGFYNIENQYRFTNGKGIIKISNLGPTKKFEVNLKYFIPEGLSTPEIRVVINENFIANNPSSLEDQGLQILYFETAKKIEIRTITIESKSFIPKDVCLNNDDIRRIGIAFIQISIKTKETSYWPKFFGGRRS